MSTEQGVTIEQGVKDVITAQLQGGIVEKAIVEQLENGIKNAMKDLFGTYGEATKVIQKQIKSVMVPYLESYDYSHYITKLDSVLVEILEETALDNKKILENFKDLMTPENLKTITTTELFEKWMEYVAEDVKTDGLDIEYDNEASYESVEVRFEVEYNEDRSWSDWQQAKIVFECDHDEELNFEIPISRWKKMDKENEWSFRYKNTHELKSLRSLSKFEIFLMKLDQEFTKLIIDSNGDEDYVVPETKPELTYE